MKESLHFSFLFLPLYLCHVLSEMGKVNPSSGNKPSVMSQRALMTTAALQGVCSACYD